MLLPGRCLGATQSVVDNDIYLVASLAVLLLLACSGTFYLFYRLRHIDPERARVASIIESSEDAILSKDLDGTILTWNKGAERLYGYSREEAVGRSIKFIAPEERFEEIDDFLEQTGRGEHVEHHETVRVRKDGGRVHISLSISPVHDRRGNIVGASAIGRDISRRKDMEERVSRGTAILQTVLSTLPAGIIVVDDDGVIRYANASVDSMFGHEEESVHGKKVEALLPDRFQGHHEALLRAYLESPVQRDMGKGRDLAGQRKDGTEFPVEIALTPLPERIENGGHIMATIVDITTRKRYERALERRTAQLERSNRELDNFAYVASHDLRSPLRGIDNLASWIEEDLGEGVSDEIREHVKLLRGRIKRMEGLLEDLLEYSRVGRKQETPERVEVGRLIDNTIELLAPPPGFEIKIDGELPVLETLATPLEQVFRNLINNAIKHHDQTAGQIVVGAEDRGEEVEFYVSDDGPGIDPEFRERIFGMFTTLRPRDEVEGSGLGLAVIEKILENCHGRIRVEGSPTGRGALFRFTWPKHITREEY